MSTPARRSGRERKVNPKYSNGGWDKETIRILRASSESSGSSPPEDSLSDEGDGEEQLAQDGENDPASEDEAYSMRSAESRSSDVETPDEDDDNMQIEADKDARSPRPFVTPR